MRSFIAIDLPVRIKDSLCRLQDEIRQSAARVSWVKPAAMHLTMKFLGEIDERQIEAIAAAIRDIALKKAGFDIKLDTLGAFPQLHAPRIIWVGVKQGGAQLENIAAELEEALDKLGIASEERRFHPHITIGRVRDDTKRKELSGRLLELKDKLLSAEAFRANKIGLFKSELTPQGPIYELLKETSFKTK